MVNLLNDKSTTLKIAEKVERSESNNKKKN